MVIVLTPFILFTIITLLFYFPPFQNWVANKVASVASEKTGMEISVGHVSLEFPLDLAVENFKMIEQNEIVVPAIKGAELGSLVYISCVSTALTGKK